MNLKNTLRSALNFLHLDLTKNLEYDRLTKAILKKIINKDAHCIDIGCHKGEILEILLAYAPQGKHYAFEPIPSFYQNLQKNFGTKAELFPYALSDSEGTSTFQFVKNAPAYSGLKKRRYDIENPEIEEIQVEIKTLDQLFAPGTRIDFVKIDVEGGEYGVLKGGKELLKAQKPHVIFECGKGGSDYYGTHPSEVYDFLQQEIGLKIFTLRAFIAGKDALSRTQFISDFETGKEYYFIASQ